MTNPPVPFFGALMIAAGLAQGIWVALRGPAKKQDCAPLSRWLPALLAMIAYLALFFYAWYQTFVHHESGYVLVAVGLIFIGQGVWDLRKRDRRFPKFAGLFLGSSLLALGVNDVAKIHSWPLIIFGTVMLGCSLIGWLVYYAGGPRAAAAE